MGNGTGTPTVWLIRAALKMLMGVLHCPKAGGPARPPGVAVTVLAAKNFSTRGYNGNDETSQSLLPEIWSG